MYVRRINISGNNRTRDEVIRREMRQLEGGWYSSDRIAASRSRIDRLGYFTEVNVETPAVQGTTDQVDVNVSVVEKPTGAVLLGAGFGSGEGLILSGSVSQQNFFGSGKHVSFGVNTSKINTTYALSFTDPYYTVDGVSRGFDLYLRRVDAVDQRPRQLQDGDRGRGDALRCARHGARHDQLRARLRADEYRNLPRQPADLYRLREHLRTEERRTARDDRVDTRRTRQPDLPDARNACRKRVSNWLCRASRSTITAHSTSISAISPSRRDYTLMVNGEHRLRRRLWRYADLPFFKNFYVGGVNSLRGFRVFTVGPKDAQGNPRGGSHKVLGNFEFLFPFPGLAGDRSVRMSAFIDTGMTAESFNFSEMRASAGIAVLWVSPMGPLKISAAYPFRDQEAAIASRSSSLRSAARSEPARSGRARRCLTEGGDSEALLHATVAAAMALSFALMCGGRARWRRS